MNKVETKKIVKYVFDEEIGLCILVDEENVCKLEPKHITIKVEVKKSKSGKRVDYTVYNSLTKETMSLASYLFGDEHVWTRKVTNHKFTRSNMKSRPKARTAKRKWIYFDRFNNYYSFCIEKNGKKYKSGCYRTQSEAIRAFNKCMKLHGFPERLDLEINK